MRFHRPERSKASSSRGRVKVRTSGVGSTTPATLTAATVKRWVPGLTLPSPMPSAQSIAFLVDRAHEGRQGMVELAKVNRCSRSRTMAPSFGPFSMVVSGAGTACELEVGVVDVEEVVVDRLDLDPYLARVTLGMASVSDPSLGVWPRGPCRTSSPPSVDSEIFTFSASARVVDRPGHRHRAPPATVVPVGGLRGHQERTRGRVDRQRRPRPRRRHHRWGRGHATSGGSA